MRETALLEKEMPTLAEAVLVGLITRNRDELECEISMNELARLLDTAGGTVAARMTQAKDSPDSRTCIGSGKLDELREICQNGKIPLAVFDCDLSPAQIKNIEDGLGDDVRVLDRSMLILDIFALHAQTAEGKLQVELAQMKYTIPRLMGHGTEMSRLGGGIGTRGPGESKLESDRRHVKRRIEALEAELSDLEGARATQRKQREKSGITKVAVAGYTNAGKSTLLNALTGAGILAEDKLFATLDPTTRRYTLPDGTELLLTDTVGFIRNLPHHLIRAFRSTLDEVLYADLILIVMDASDPQCASQLDVTRSLIEELGAQDKPVLYVLNKCDMCEDRTALLPISPDIRHTVCISAKEGTGLDELLALLTETVHMGKRSVTLRFAHTEMAQVTQLYRVATVENVEYLDDGIYVRATVDAKAGGMYSAYIVEGNGASNDG